MDTQDNGQRCEVIGQVVSNQRCGNKQGWIIGHPEEAACHGVTAHAVEYQANPGGPVKASFHATEKSTQEDGNYE
jgi:hypothetical protein